MGITVKTFDKAEAAAGQLAADRNARFMAGGTLVMRGVNEAMPSLSTIVMARDRAMRQIETRGEQVSLGAGVTMRQILSTRELDVLHPVAQVIGGPAVRAMATVGGNLFARSPFGDFATALLALDATVSLAGSSGGRPVPLADFLRDREREPRPLVLAVSFRRPRQGDFRFRKVSRIKPKGAAVITIAALLPQQGGRVAGARVAFGAMGPTPLRAPAVEQALEGKSLDAAGIAQALAAASTGLEPADDAIASAWYRREVAPVHLRRLLLNE